MPQLGGKSFVDRNSGGTPILQRSDTGTVNWSSGWVNTDGTTSVANGAALTFDHNLGSNDLIVQVYMAKDANGTDQTLVVNELVQSGASNFEWGCHVQNVTSNQLTVQLLQDGTTEFTPTGHTSYSWGTTYTHIKVVATAGSGGSGAGSGMLLLPSYLGPTQSGNYANVNNNSGYVVVKNTSETVKMGNVEPSPRAYGLRTAATISVRIWGSVTMAAGGEADRLTPRIYMGTESSPRSTGTQLFPSTRPWGNSTSAQSYDVTITDAFTMPAWDGGDATRVYILVENNGNNGSGTFNIDYWIKDYNFAV